MKKPLRTHTFNFSPSDNSGESLVLTTDFIENGDKSHPSDGVFLNQTLTLNSYCNSASFNLYNAILTPELLRKLADELEVVKFNACPVCSHLKHIELEYCSQLCSHEDRGDS